MKESWDDNTKTLIFDGSGAFTKQNIHVDALNITLKEGFTSLGDQCFINYIQLRSVSLPETLEKIGNNIIQNTQLHELFLPKGVKEIHNLQSFDNCITIASISVSEENKYFCSKDGILYSKDLKTLCFCPPNRTEYPLMIPDGVTSIALAAFSASKTLRFIILPPSIEKIDQYFLYGSKSIEKVIIMKCPSLIKFDKGNILVGTGKNEKDIIEYKYFKCSRKIKTKCVNLKRDGQIKVMVMIVFLF